MLWFTAHEVAIYQCILYSGRWQSWRRRWKCGWWCYCWCWRWWWCLINPVKKVLVRNWSTPKLAFRSRGAKDIATTEVSIGVCHGNGWSENLFAIGTLQQVTHCEVSDMIGQFGQWQARTLWLTADCYGIEEEDPTWWLYQTQPNSWTTSQSDSWTVNSKIQMSSVRSCCLHNWHLNI